jgi:hypothetical protein
VGGPTISSDRFFDELKAIKIKYGGEVYDIPQVICFTEFKPNEEDMLVKLYEKNVHEVFEGKFWFIPQPTIARRGGICFLVANSIASIKPNITTIVPDRMYNIEVGMHEDLCITTKVFGVYGSNVRKERQALQPHLLNALSDNAVIMGDFNGTSSPFDTVGAAMGGNMWPWFTHKENDLSLIDSFKAYWGGGASGGALADD